MAGFYHLYLPLILQMRSGDIETNPGPNTPESTVSEEEFILLSESMDRTQYLGLGLHLGIPYVELKEHSQGLLIDALMEMFIKWRSKQLPGTNIRAIVAEKLQTCRLYELSGRLLDGSLLSNTTSKPSVPSTSSSSPTHEPLPSEKIQECAEDFNRSTVSDEEFILLSEQLGPDEYLKLGIRLGMSYALLKEIKIQSHDDYNDAFIQVFTKWRNKQLPDTNMRAALHEIFVTCKLRGLTSSVLYESCLSNTTSKPSVPSTSSSSPTHKPLPSEKIQECAEDFNRSTVSDEEFFLLSELIDPSEYMYMRLGMNLGIPYSVVRSIKSRSDDGSDAFLQVFMKWNIKQLPGTNTRAILAEKLQNCCLDELSCRLLDGSLLSNTASKRSVPPPSLSSPPRQPLSPELIQKCAEDFKSMYRTSLCKIRADPLNPDSLVQFEDMYFNIVSEGEHGRYKRLLEYIDFVKLKDKSKFTRRVLVQGEAGAGKTTFCAKIAWDWINGKHFQEFEWVIIVPLREAKKYSIGEIAKSYLTSNNPTTASQLTEYMHLNTDKVFIVFDGLDEFDEDDAQPEEDGSQTSGLQSSQSQGQSLNTSGSTQYQAEFQSASGKKKVPSAEMKIGVEEILKSDKLETVPVMVTTRPWKAIEIRRNDKLRKNYTFLYVEGFSKENVASYIQKYFVGDNAAAESLIQFVHDNDIISENMAPYPIYIAMLCLMWREFDEEKQKTMKALQTFSQIFDEIFVFLKEHYALKMSNPSCSLDESLNDCLKDVNQLLEPVASLALNGLLKNTLVFSEGDFEHCQDSMKTACRVGLLSEESKIILGKGRRNASNPRMKPTVFFPHKLFQEFMAGIHLASLYETDNREYNRLMETVTGRRKEEFRYLLYFTASQTQRVGIDVLTRIWKSIEEAAASRDFIVEMIRLEKLKRDKHFLVDVAFECHDTQAAAVVKDKVSLENATLKVDCYMTAHTLAGYAFIKTDLARLTVSKECGPTMSREVAEMICSLPSLRKVELARQFHDNFFTTIAAKGQFSKIQSLTVTFGDVQISASASHDLAVALGSMPNLTELKMNGMYHLQDEFYSKLSSLASSMKMQSVTIRFALVVHVRQFSGSASHDLAVALGSMPYLTELKLDEVGHLHDEFFSTLKVMAASMKIQSLTIRFAGLVSISASHDLAVSLGSMPNLTELELDGALIIHDEFISTLKAMAASMKIQSLTIRFAGLVSTSASHDLAVSLGSMPNLTELELDGAWILHDEFISSLKAMAASMKIQSLTIRFAGLVSASALHDLAVSLGSMPNLTELILCRVGHLHDEFFSTLKAMAACMKIQSLTIRFALGQFSASASHDLAVSLGSMPNLTELKLDVASILHDEFISTLKAIAASMKVHLPGSMKKKQLNI